MLGLLAALACVTVPTPPVANDPAYSIEHPRWSIVGNALTPGSDTFDATVDGPSATTVWLDGEPYPIDAGVVSIDVSELAPGDHTVIWASGRTAFAATTLNRSHPMYVVPSVDWDSPDTDDAVLEWQQALHADHPALRITHFVGPYTWTDPTLAPERKDVLDDWLRGYRDDHGDEIALHIHPYCHFVETTSVACRTTPSFAYDDGDDTGYTVPNWAYTEDEFAELVGAADQIFESRGFDKPTSYRAGGWSATTDVLRALARQGYVADTSANNWAELEEWEGTGTLYSWNAENWSEIDGTSQPYYPDNDDAQRPGDDPIGILEVPDNGILADYVDHEEMIALFELNYDREPLDEPTQFSMGWHDSANPDYRARVMRTFDEIDRHLAINDDGPVIYETLSNLALVWPAP